MQVIDCHRETHLKPPFKLISYISSSPLTLPSRSHFGRGLNPFFFFSFASLSERLEGLEAGPYEDATQDEEKKKKARKERKRGKKREKKRDKKERKRENGVLYPRRRRRRRTFRETRKHVFYPRGVIPLLHSRRQSTLGARA